MKIKSLIIILTLLFTYNCKSNNSGETLIDPWENWSFTFSAPDDPYYQYQWHIKNTGQDHNLGGSPSTAGEDANIYPAWQADYWGQYITIAIIDDGLAINHEDLQENNWQQINYNYLNGGTDTTSGGYHGTSVAGVAAARGWNSKGVIGAAPWSQLACFNLLQNGTSQNTQNAMERRYNIIDVSNNSWGPDDDGGLYTHDSLWEVGINNGLNLGRDGKGIIYVWAGGNGGQVNDNSNYDGYANFYGVIAVAAVGSDGKRANYSERGSNIWVTAPSEGNNNIAIVTTDLYGFFGYSKLSLNSNYTDSFNGTSSAAPLVSGVVALVLSANQNLTWRDVKLILARSARKCDAADSEWTTNNAGQQINYKYGFGVVDADAATTMAAGWTNINSLKTHTSGTSTVNQSIPDNNSTGINNTITISSSEINKIEYIEIDVEIDHSYSGDLEIILTSPNGTESILSEAHITANNDFFDGGNTFTFGSARHLDEAINGNWTITVKDLSATNTGTFTSWSLKFYGRQE